MISVIVPTKGRPQLEHTLKSIPADVQAVVVGDGQTQARRIFDEFQQPGWVYEETNRTDDVGHTQRNHGMTLATGTWLAFMDDDDTFTPDAFQHFQTVTVNRPHIFRMRYVDTDELLWKDPELLPGNVGTPMFLVPNIPGLLGRWEARRCGDFDFIQQTCELQGDPVWREEIVALVRPNGTI